MLRKFGGVPFDLRRKMDVREEDFLKKINIKPSEQYVTVRRLRKSAFTVWGWELPFVSSKWGEWDLNP